MGKVYRHPGNRSNQWRKHTGAKRYRCRSLGLPMRLVFVNLPPSIIGAAAIFLSILFISLSFFTLSPSNARLERLSNLA